MKKSVLMLALLTAGGAFADHFWKGQGTTSDWSDAANWVNALSDGNGVFGGSNVSSLPDTNPIVASFTNAQTTTRGIWIENETKADVVWQLGENADADAGLTSTWGTWDSMTVGTGKHGGLTIKGGTYVNPKQLLIGNGTGADSYLTLDGGSFTNGSYVCIGYGGYNRTATMNVNGGDFTMQSDAFIIGQGNNAGCIGVFNQTGGTVTIASGKNVTCSENAGKSYFNLSNGTFTVGNQFYMAEGKSGKATTEAFVGGGTLNVGGNFLMGGKNSSVATLTATGGVVSIGNEMHLGEVANSTNLVVQKGGEVSVGTYLDVGYNAPGTYIVSNGTLNVVKNRLIVGVSSTGEFVLEDGSVSWGDQLMAGYNAAGTGKVVVNGGELAANKLLQIGLNGTGVFEQNGGTVSCTSFRTGTDSSSAVGAATVNCGSLTATSDITVGGKGTGTMIISNGTVRTTGTFNVATGSSATGTVEIVDGSFSVSGLSLAGSGANARATIAMTNGTFDTDNEFVLGSGTGSEVAMTLSGGTFTPKKFWVGSHYSYTKDGCTASFTMTDGTLTTDNDQDIVVGGEANAVGTFEMKGGTVNCGNTFHIAWNGTGTLKMSGGDIYLRSGKNLYFAQYGTSATMELTGGTFHTDNIVKAADTETVTRSLLVNGGAFAAVSAKTDWLTDITIPVGASGIGLNTDSGATCCATLTPSEEGGTIKVLITGTTVPALSETTLSPVSAFEIADGARVAIAKDATVAFAKPTSFAGGKLVLDGSGIEADGNYELCTVTGLAEGTTLSTENVELANLPGKATLSYAVSDAGVVTVTVEDLEAIVWNDDKADWNKAGAWKNSASGESVTIAATDIANFVLTAANATNTVLVNETIAQKRVVVKATGENACEIFKGHGTYAAVSTKVSGTLGFAGDDEGALTLNAPLEDAGSGKLLFASGTVNLDSELPLDAVNNARIVRTTNWTPTNAMTGDGEIVISNATLTVNQIARFRCYNGTITVGKDATLVDSVEWHGENKSGCNSYGYGFGENTTIRMAGGTIPNFSNNGQSSNESIGDVIVADGTTNVWSNYKSRSDIGCNVNLEGTFSGSGTLKLGSNGRGFAFNSDLSTFSGTLECSGYSYGFNKGIKGGTVIVNSDATIGSTSLAVDDAMLVLKNTNANTTFAIGANAVLGTTSAATVKGVTFTSGAKLRLVGDDALSDRTATYVALTSSTAIDTAALPTLESATTDRGTWKLSVNEVTADDVTTYQLVAKFYPKGLTVIIR